MCDILILESILLKPFGDIYHADNAYDYDKLRISTNFWIVEQEAMTSDVRRYIQPEKKILDLPVGTGRFLELYTQKCLEVTGVDLSAEMLEKCADKGREFPGSLSLIQSASYPLPFEDLSFDYSVSFRFLQSIISMDDVRKTLEELKRVTNVYLILELGYRDEGVFRWGLPGSNYTMRKLLYKEELFEFLASCGLEVVSQSRVVQQDSIGKQRIFICRKII